MSQQHPEHDDLIDELADDQAAADEQDVEGDHVTQPADQLEEAEGGDPAAADPLADVDPAIDNNTDQDRGPQGARGYDSDGNVRPADNRADVLLVPGEDDETEEN